MTCQSCTRPPFLLLLQSILNDFHQRFFVSSIEKIHAFEKQEFFLACGLSTAAWSPNFFPLVVLSVQIVGGQITQRDIFVGVRKKIYSRRNCGSFPTVQYSSYLLPPNAT
jgi:hypothetical protein